MRAMKLKNYGWLALVIIVLFGTEMATAESVGIESDLLSYTVLNYDEDEEILDYNGDNVYAIASITKLMTYYVAMDAVEKGEIGQTDLVTIGDYPPTKKGSTMALEKGEEVPFSKLLEGIMICSANDACVAIDEHVAGTEKAFVAKMNEEAKRMGLKTAHFINSTGLTENGAYNVMSARDVAKLAQNVIERFPEVLDLSSKRYVDHKGEVYPNTNPLIWEMEGVDGLKTGATIQAKNCLVATMKMPMTSYNQKRGRIIAVTIGAETEEIRKTTTQRLLEYTTSHFGYQNILSAFAPLGQVTTANGGKVYAYPQKNLCGLPLKNRKYTHQIEWTTEKLEASQVKAGTVLGKVNLYKNGELYDTTPLVVKAEPEYYKFFMALFQKFTHNKIG